MAAYLKTLKDEPNALLARGIRREQMPAGLADSMLSAPNLERTILDKLKGKPGGLSLKELRASLGAPPKARAEREKAKAEFDRVVLCLYRDARVYLDRHDHPLRLSDAERCELVYDGVGNYYVGITLRGEI